MKIQDDVKIQKKKLKIKNKKIIDLYFFYLFKKTIKRKRSTGKPMLVDFNVFIYLKYVSFLVLKTP